MAHWTRNRRNSRNRWRRNEYEKRSKTITGYMKPGERFCFVGELRNLRSRSACGISFAVFVCRPLFRRFLILLVNSPYHPAHAYSFFFLTHEYLWIVFYTDLLTKDQIKKKINKTTQGVNFLWKENNLRLSKSLFYWYFFVKRYYDLRIKKECFGFLMYTRLR